MSPYLLESSLVADILAAAERMGLYCEQLGQRKAKGSGTTTGAPDLILYGNGRMVPLEVKRPKTDGTRAGRFSLDQLVAAENRRHRGVETYAPSTLEHAVSLMNWIRCGTGPVCQDCPTVPRIGGEA